MITKEQLENYKELTNAVINTTYEVACKIAKEVDYPRYSGFTSDYLHDDIYLEVYNDGISVIPGNMNDCMEFNVKPCTDSDIPIEALYDSEALDNYINNIKLKKEEDEIKHRDYEYKEYLRLKEKFEGK